MWNEVITEKTHWQTSTYFYPVCLNLKCMLTSSDMATVYVDLLLFIFIYSKSETADDAWDNFYYACGAWEIMLKLVSHA